MQDLFNIEGAKTIVDVMAKLMTQPALLELLNQASLAVLTEAMHKASPEITKEEAAQKRSISVAKAIGILDATLKKDIDASDFAVPEDVVQEYGGAFELKEFKFHIVCLMAGFVHSKIEDTDNNEK